MLVHGDADDADVDDDDAADADDGAIPESYLSFNVSNALAISGVADEFEETRTSCLVVAFSK